MLQLPQSPRRTSRPAASTKPLSRQEDKTDERRAKAYADMEPHLCDVMKMGRIADQLSVDPDRELYDFAVHRLADMLEDLRKRYYAEEFPR